MTKKEYKKQFFKNNQMKNKRLNELNSSLNGFLIMCDKNKEKSSVKDVYDILNNAIELYYPQLIEKLEHCNKKILEENELNEKITINTELNLKEQSEIDSSIKNIENKEIVMTDENYNENDKNSFDEKSNKMENKNFDEIFNEKFQNADKKNEKPKHFKKQLIKMFYNFETNCQGIVFIKIDELFRNDIDVIYLIRKIFEKSKIDKVPISKYFSKIFPMVFVKKTNMSNIKEGALVLKDSIKKIKTENKINSENKENQNEQQTFRIDIRIRNNSSIIKSDVINIVLNSIEDLELKVDYDNPKYTIFIDITADLLCMTVLEDINVNRGYNINNLIKSDEELKAFKELQYKENELNKKSKDEFKNKYNSLEDNKIENEENNKKENDDIISNSSDNEDFKLI